MCIRLRVQFWSGHWSVPVKLFLYTNRLSLRFCPSIVTCIMYKSWLVSLLELKWYTVMRKQSHLFQEVRLFTLIKPETIILRIRLYSKASNRVSLLSYLWYSLQAAYARPSGLKRHLRGGGRGILGGKFPVLTNDAF